MTEHREQNAAFIAPAVPVLLLFVFGLFSSGSQQWDFLILVIALLTSYIGTFMFGMPLVNLLRHFNLLNLPVLVLSGSVLGVLVLYLSLYSVALLLGSTNSINWITVLWGALFGFIVSITFGLIAGITRHWKNDAKNARLN